VLLVEDDPTNQRIVAAALEQCGYPVATAASGDEALRIFRLEQPGLVLMDIKIPHPDGFETTARIRGMERATGEHTPIIAVTACAFDEDREHCLAVGMDDYVSKPFKLADLFDAIDRVMRSPPRFRTAAGERGSRTWFGET
jgi:CheY-like chemotaxis protein